MQVHLKPYKPEDKQEQEAKSTICGHLQRMVIRTLLITIWHNQDLGGKYSYRSPILEWQHANTFADTFLHTCID